MRSPVIASAAGMNVTETASARSTARASPGPNVSRNPSCAATSDALAAGDREAGGDHGPGDLAGGALGRRREGCPSLTRSRKREMKKIA